MKRQNLIITYRYLIRFKDSDQCAAAVHSLTESEHQKYITTLLSNENIVSAVREYIHEINVDKLYNIDTLKKEKE